MLQRLSLVAAVAIGLSSSFFVSPEARADDDRRGKYRVSEKGKYRFKDDDKSERRSFDRWEGRYVDKHELAKHIRRVAHDMRRKREKQKHKHRKKYASP